ncbi:unnamed protein product [Rotaria sordida]|uniref:ATPase AAA-type core domain-containing protein n=1 Tax=Rotaria sordida TaxID=392033 RepID=A0A814XLZ1_9BILA|nr:unnamed protein product [Rotaria sordida]CAF1377299.1 unnamed protein product [Rotaria sordida]CAF1398296.1 unnamed protein product [Rotaria sordida]CAF1471655.1 unnamed protein product [Rotaria sordida]CAF1614536.1 unnamed protein product [Rotaria sordida]
MSKTSIRTIDFVYLGYSINFRVQQQCDDINLIDSFHSNLPIFYRIYLSITSIIIQFKLMTINNNIENKSISLSDIGGLKREKSDLTNLLLQSTTNYISLRRIFPHGAKRRGKTLLINAIAHEISATIIRIHLSNIYKRRLTATLIELLDRHLDGKNIFLMVTTKWPDLVDTDLRRPGRIDEEIEIGMANQQD